MHHRFLLRLLVGVFFAAVSLRAQAPGTAAAAPAPMAPGLVLVAKVTGQAWITSAGTTDRVELKVDMQVPQAAKITTANNASVVLVFSNGAQTQLGGDTELVLEEFLQDPFANTIRVSEMEAEPSLSHTKLALNRGELVGNVKKLTRGARESTFTVKTPVGAAGIRGTTFRIVFRPSGNGQAFNFQLTTAEGNVAFVQGNGGNSAAGNNVTGSGTTTVPVLGGQEIFIIDVQVTQNAQGQTVVTVVPPAPTQAGTAPTTTIAAVTEVAIAVATAAAQTTFTSATPPGNSQGGGGGTNQGTSGTNPPATETGGTTGGTSGSTTGGTSGSTTGSTTGSPTGSTTGSTTLTTTSTTTTSTPTGGATTTTQSNVTGQTASGQGFSGQLNTTTTTPQPVVPARITSNPGP